MKKCKISSTCLLIILLLGLTLAPATLLAQANRGAGVPVEALPKELKGLDIKDYYVSSTQKKAGIIHALRGNVVVIHKSNNTAYFGKEGDYIHENDSLNTLSDSRCRVKLLDDDVITLGENAIFGVDSFEDQREQRKKASVFSMMKGKAMFYAMRLFRYKEVRTRVKTPTAVVGVRGTQFGIGVYRLDEEKRSDAGIRVADSGNDAGMYLAQAPEGVRTYTVTYCVDGEITVNEFTLSPGELFDQLANIVRPFTQSELLEFKASVTVSVEKENQTLQESDDAAGREAAGEPVADTGAEDLLQSQIDVVEEVIASVQEQASEETSEAHSTPDRPTRNYGYFTGMLVNTTSTDYLEAIYISSIRQNADGSSVKADQVTGLDTVNTSWYTEADGSQEPPYGKEVILAGTSSGTLGTSYEVNDHEMGHNSYQAWGYWTMTQEFTIGANTYYFDNKGYYMEGDYTADNDMPSGGSYAYSGQAGGTCFDADHGTDMSGTFTADVNFGNASITDFDLSVSGGGASASIDSASGTFSSSHFQLSGGTWKIGNTTVTNRRAAYGSLYGPNGVYMGGVWSMKQDSSTGAVGFFQGKR